jgi:demethylmenaquinone methyltransferase/2-methoxy-6-polyprenyl-1,4-benzoquinol methylase
MTRALRRVAPDPQRKEAGEVARMFGAIAPTYDFLNHTLSLNVDRYWRAMAVRAMEPNPHGLYLDLCTGTGDLAFALARRSGALVVGLDFTKPMLDLALKKAHRRRRKIHWVQADALRLPLRDECVDGITVAFGVRNFEDLERGLTEAARVLKAGGRLVVLEFSEPQGRLFGPLYRLYFRRLLPRIGALFSRVRGPYGYLAATVQGFPEAAPFAETLRRSGFVVIRQRPLTGGIATLHVALRERRKASMGGPGERHESVEAGGPAV